MTHSRQLGIALGASLLFHGILLSEIRIHPQTSAHRESILEIDMAPLPEPLVPPAVPVVSSRPRENFPHPSLPEKAPESGQAHQVRSQSPGESPPAGNAVPAPPGMADVRLRSLEMIQREVTDPFAGLKVRRLFPQTRDNIFGPYEEAYRQKVEQVGSVNYPAPVEGRALFGTVRLTVTIRQDGSLALVEIRQSSGSADLDDAARRIVQMAAPFQPFTPDMRARADLVSITRSFNFIRAGEAVRSQ